MSCLGKGFWVGLILMVTGLVGLLSSREGTRSALVAFTALATLSTVLSFYMAITCIKPVQRNAQLAEGSRSTWQSNELILNCVLITAGALASVVGSLSSVLGCVYAGLCQDQRRPYVFTGNAARTVLGTPVPIKYSLDNDTPQLTFPFQSANVRMAI
jgi:hypothetical protein